MNKINILLIFLFLLAGCTNGDNYYGDVYTADQVNRVQEVAYGTVVSVRAVKIQANAYNGRNSNVVGTVSGATLGGFLGNTISRGPANPLVTVTGIIGGAIIGSSIENKSSRVNGVELGIKQENGTTIVIVQKGDATQFQVGQAVRMIKSGRQVKVAP